jgi:type I restriction enzyme S subunit
VSEIRLSDVFRVGSSKRVLKSDWKDSGVPFYRGREITRLSKTGYADNELFISEEHFSDLSMKYGIPVAGDILVTAIGTIGNTYIVKAEDRFYFKDASVIWLHKFKEVDSQYVNYWLKSELFFKQLDRGNGATVDTLTIEKLSSVKLILPPLKKQREIVAKLDKAFADIDLVEANLQQSEERASELLGSLLAASLMSSEIEPASNTLLQRDIDMKIVKLSEVCSFSRGLTYGKGDEVESSSNVVLRANNIDLSSNSLNFADLRYIKDSITIKDEKIAKKGSIIICTASGSKSHVGKVALIDEDYGYAYGGFMGQLTPLDNCLPKYLYFTLISRQFKDYLMTLNDGTNINNLKFADIEDYELPLPPLEIQSRIVEKLDLAFSEVEKVRNQIAIKKDFTGMLRQSLLSQSFSAIDEKVSA